MKIAVVLSGCGVYDGSEIYETVAVLLALSKQGKEVICLAPDSPQHHVVDHASGNDSNEKRSVFTEAARLARGEITKLENVSASEFDAIIFPGGFGAAKNLSTFAFDGTSCRVLPSVENFIKQARDAGKPMGFICIAPVIAARVFQGQKFQLTVGQECDVSKAIQALGHTHVVCDVHSVCVDKENRIVSTPAYMLARNIAEAASGVEKLVAEIVKMATK